MTEKNQPYSFLHIFKKLIGLEKEYVNNKIKYDEITSKEEEMTIQYFSHKLQKLSIFSNKEKEYFQECEKVVKENNRNNKFYAFKHFIVLLSIFLVVSIMIFAAPTPIKKQDYNKINFNNFDKETTSMFWWNKYNWAIDELEKNKLNKDNIIQLWQLYNQKAHLIYKDFILNNLNYVEKSWNTIISTFVNQWKKQNLSIGLNWFKMETSYWNTHAENNISLFWRLKQNIQYYSYFLKEAIKKPFLLSSQNNGEEDFCVLKDFLFYLLIFLLGLVTVLTIIGIYVFSIPKKNKHFEVFWKTFQTMFDMFNKKIKEYKIIQKMQELINLEKSIDSLIDEQKKITKESINIKSYNKNIKDTIDKYQKQIEELKIFFETNHITWDLFKIVKIIVKEKWNLSLEDYYLEWRYKSDLFYWLNIISLALMSFVFYFVLFLFIFLGSPNNNDIMQHRLIANKIELMLKSEDKRITKENKPYLYFMSKNIHLSPKGKEMIIIKAIQQDIHNTLNIASLNKENKMFSSIQEIEVINNKIEQIVNKIKQNTYTIWNNNGNMSIYNNYNQYKTNY